jgi:heat shock protein HslJ
MNRFTRWTPLAAVIAFAFAVQAGAQPQELAGTSWQLVQIHNADGTSERPDDPNKYTLEFERDGSLVARLNCNRGHGTWKSTSPGQLQLGVMAVTLAACLPPSLDTRMAKDLGAVHSYAIENGHLHLNLSSGGFYEFVPHAAAGLPGTSWQLLEIRNADGTVLHPSDPANYTVTFEADGSVIARLDCNHGRGTWKSTSAGQIELGPMALTRAMCPPGSLSDRVAKDWSSARSYTIEDGHLRLMFPAGDYEEFEPFAQQSPAP